MAVRSHLRHRRMERHLTQTELAAKLGVQRSHLSRWERGSVCPSLDMALLIAEVLGFPVEQIFERVRDSE